jgi:hypothetical protein
MLNQLWSDVQHDPPLAIAMVLIAVVLLWVVALTVYIVAEGKSAGATTAAALRKDVHTAQRRAWIRSLQRKFNLRRAS